MTDNEIQDLINEFKDIEPLVKKLSLRQSQDLRALLSYQIKDESRNIIGNDRFLPDKLREELWSKLWYQLMCSMEFNL